MKRYWLYSFILAVCLLSAPSLHAQDEITEAAFKKLKQAKAAFADQRYADAVKELTDALNLNDGKSSSYLHYMLILSTDAIGDYANCLRAMNAFYAHVDTAKSSLTPSLRLLYTKSAQLYYADKDKYDEAYDKHTTYALKDYLDHHDYPAFKTEALERIDDLDYGDASKANTELSYATYLRLHPGGKHMGEAKRNANRLVEKDNTMHTLMSESYGKAAKSETRKGIIWTAVGVGFAYADYRVWTSDKLDETTKIVAGCAPAVLAFTSLTFGIVNLAFVSSNRKYMENEEQQIRPLPYTVSVSPQYLPGQNMAGLHLSIKI